MVCDRLYLYSILWFINFSCMTEFVFVYATDKSVIHASISKNKLMHTR